VIVLKRDKWLAGVRDAAIIAVITIVLCEIGLRMFHHFHPLPFFYTDSYNRFRVKPHSTFYGFKINSRGFHDVEFRAEKEPDVFRILGIGDSFAFGVVPYRFNYLTLIEEQLNRNGRRFELLNMGIPGLNPREYLALLLREGLELKPDMVLLSFFVGNDFVETAKVDRVYRYVYLANVLKYLYDLNTRMANFDGSALKAYDDEGMLSTSRAYVERALSLTGLFLKGGEKFEPLLANTMSHLGALARICKLYSIRLAVVIIPDELQVDTELHAQVIAASGLAREAFDFDQPNARLTALLRGQGIDHLDLLPSFRETSRHTRLYRRNDSHWNIKGNALAAELILQHLGPEVAAPRAN
jgi:SGNH hydrolase-like domain, acetyltransferase AlgX